MGGFIGIIIGLLLTLFVYSYLVGDNPLYKISVHILVGVSAAYAGVVIVKYVLAPIASEIQTNPTATNSLIWFIPFFFSLLLLLQRLPSIAWLSQLSVAFMIGIGGAVALTGAIMGTLIPQTLTVGDDTLFRGQSVLVAVLTAVTLLSFQFTRRARADDAGEAINQESRLSRIVQQVARLVLTITFGFLFAAALNSSLLVLTNRVAYFFEGLGQLIQ